MEAADKHRSYAPKSSYNSGRGYKPRRAGAVTSTYPHYYAASLSKTDKAERISPPIHLKSWREDASLYPVAVIRTLLEARDALDIRHDRLFFNAHRPDSMVTLKTFRGFITRSLRDASIEAPPGSTRATAGSSALGRGVSMGYILRMAGLGKKNKNLNKPNPKFFFFQDCGFFPGFFSRFMFFF
jgi:hypothetical protein